MNQQPKWSVTVAVPASTLPYDALVDLIKMAARDWEQYYYPDGHDGWDVDVSTDLDLALAQTLRDGFVSRP